MGSVSHFLGEKAAAFELSEVPLSWGLESPLLPGWGAGREVPGLTWAWGALCDLLPLYDPIPPVKETHAGRGDLLRVPQPRAQADAGQPASGASHSKTPRRREEMAQFQTTMTLIKTAKYTPTWI